MSKRRVRGVAPRSVTLTYDQLKFLDGKANASEWVRGAVEQAMKIERGELVIARLGEDHWSRLIREGVRPAMADPWSEIVRLAFDVAEAHEEAKERDRLNGDRGEETFKAFHMPSFQINEALREILRAGNRTHNQASSRPGANSNRYE